jgi:plasmid stabilization system protein ParE
VESEERQEEPKVEQLHEAESVRDRLADLDELGRSFPEGHNMRVIIEELHLEWALRAVEEEIRTLREALLHPGGT